MTRELSTKLCTSSLGAVDGRWITCKQAPRRQRIVSKGRSRVPMVPCPSISGYVKLISLRMAAQRERLQFPVLVPFCGASGFMTTHSERQYLVGCRRCFTPFVCKYGKSLIFIFMPCNLLQKTFLVDWSLVTKYNREWQMRFCIAGKKKQPTRIMSGSSCRTGVQRFSRRLLLLL